MYINKVNSKSFKHYREGLLHFTLDTYLIMLSVKQGGTKYQFLSFGHDSTYIYIYI